MKKFNSVFAFLSVAVISSALVLSCSSRTVAEISPFRAAYLKAGEPVADRVEDLLGRMTIREKIGQMTQIEKGSLRSGDVKEFFLGSVLSGGGGVPPENTPQAWSDMTDAFQKEALSTRLAIPILYGVDAVHGHNNLKDATIFPHNIGLGAAGDADLARRIGSAVAAETGATGIIWNFAPCLAVARDPRWGRTYESFSQDASLVSALGAAYIEGYQSSGSGDAVHPIATAKHYLGDGGTGWKTSSTTGYSLDQGDTSGDDAYLRGVLLPPYEAAIAAGARTVMVSFSSWNGTKMHARKDLVTDLLKGELGFTGFVVSDWGGMDQVSGDYYEAVVSSINAGVDMNMVPYDAPRFIKTVEKAVEGGDIAMDRIDDAVRRILTVKFESGIFEHPYANRELAKQVRSADHLALAREAVAKSVVVLENNGALPLKKGGDRLFVAGAAADDIGIQCGGWTLEWQGLAGDVTEGTTVLEAIREKKGDAEIVYEKYGRFETIDRSATCVVVVGELPYAEGKGDTELLSLRPADVKVIEHAKESFDTVVLVLLSGRPLVMEESLKGIDAFAAAWLPGTEGSGVADVLFGDVAPSGKLPFAWPRSTDQLPIGRIISGEKVPRYPAGFGLTY